MENRVVLVDSCFASPLGNHREEAVARLQAGLSGIVSLDHPFLKTGALIHPDPQDSDTSEVYPGLSERYTRALWGFFDRLRQVVGGRRIDKLFLICKRPFLPRWTQGTREFDDQVFLKRFLQRIQLPIAPGSIHLLQAACSSGLIALNLVIRDLLRKPDERVMLLGIEAELTPERFLPLKKLGVLSAQADPRRACQPFSTVRTGLVPGEVAVALVLEARPLDSLENDDIILRAGCSNSDAYRLTDGLESGDWLQQCVARTSVAGDRLDFVCPHGTSTPLNDRVEGTALAQHFAHLATPMTLVPLKQYVGHSLDSSGLWETLLVAELLRNNFLPPILNQDPQEQFPGLQFVRTLRNIQLSKALKVSIGFGGLNSTLLVEKAC